MFMARGASLLKVTWNDKLKWTFWHSYFRILVCLDKFIFSQTASLAIIIYGCYNIF